MVTQIGLIDKVKKTYLALCQTVGAALHTPAKPVAQLVLFAIGFGLLTCGLLHESSAAVDGRIKYNETRITESVNAVLMYIEGSFGALVLVAAGIGAILSAAFGQYRAALGLMVVAIGSFILRSLMSTFFNDKNIRA